VIRALHQIYGDKKIKFVLATDNYRIGEEDTKRMVEKKIFHLNENAYKYIQGLLKSYKFCVNYQFYGMMFKNELISSKRIRVPALKGKMGGFDYYMMSIEPETLLKMGFVLHRTKVNDSMAPTYQRLLSAKRLPGITNFIQNGGYFPNSLIVNFDTTSSKKMKIQFDLAENSSEDSNLNLVFSAYRMRMVLHISLTVNIDYTDMPARTIRGLTQFQWWHLRIWNHENNFRFSWI
jgi:DNA sulfur modification protein DndB